MAEHNKVGKWGEQVAEDYLVGRGCAIVERNVRIAGIEIDIIATKGERMMFVEVKTRTTGKLDPMMAITNSKKQRMVRAANAYISEKKVKHRPQFDIIAIVGDKENYTLDYYPDAFLPPLTRSFRGVSVSLPGDSRGPQTVKSR